MKKLKSLLYIIATLASANAVALDRPFKWEIESATMTAAMEGGDFLPMKQVGSDFGSIVSAGIKRRSIVFHNADAYLFEYGKSPQKLDFDLSSDGMNEGGYFFLADDGVYFLLKRTDMESGWGELIRADEEFQLETHRNIPAFNLFPPLLSDHGLLIGGVGYLALLDRKTLEYRWCRKDLYQKYSANHWRKIETDGSRVYAVAEKGGLDTAPGLEFVFDIESGKLIEAPPERKEDRVDRPVRKCPEFISESE